MSEQTEKPKVSTSIWVEPDLWEAAKECARKERRSLASLLMLALEEYLVSRGAWPRQAENGESKR